MKYTTFKHSKQQGAALVVGLVLMTVLTILAISTMRTATLELAMAGNAQYHEQAAQLAEAGINDAIQRINADTFVLSATEDWNNSFTVTVDITDTETALGQYEVIIRFISIGVPPSGADIGQIEAHYYEIESTGTSAARNARSKLVQGFYTQQAT